MKDIEHKFEVWHLIPLGHLLSPTAGVFYRIPVRGAFHVSNWRKDVTPSNQSERFFETFWVMSVKGERTFWYLGHLTFEDA